MYNILIHNSEDGVEIVNRYFLHANETHSNNIAMFYYSFRLALKLVGITKNIQQI